ncbi:MULTISPECIES: recombination mediator RecR [unclassified Oceanispirochaeta]|uniref:recombination mediator RecR n=1 Tax=unclassified Oceanispirochaeta TaxID=2635722 RepID=UPI000E099007|nr:MULTISPECIES: recombination mediator RecR [unclassified Oceanispirochaeta]MBF9015224.1 recombination protein RecR [Oceanispirochaeta sp. M2]NPD71682.1 recombination protein RecR [Oceanispirochaeta sp. M1]RDG32879.1 recombination protein RecR [Oceanispirochaeta sp. M1]
MNTLENLITLLSRLPGIGKKSAVRMAYSLLKGDEDYNRLLGQSIGELKERIHKCKECGNYTEDDLCVICSSSDRDSKVLCVVEESQDIMMIESTGDFRGLYFVLHGVLSPLDGIGPSELGFERLMERIESLGVSEIILATNPTLEGDSTALYIKHLLDGNSIRISRIASGLPVGGDMEYADTMSISRALKGRMEY